MDPLADPAILFFVFGVFAGLVKSNLEIPPAIARFLSLYLLMALGLKGGFALAQSGLTVQVAIGLSLAMSLALVVPCLSYLGLRKYLGGFDAAALSATYGSVSAVTFITAMNHLESLGLGYGGHMAAAMALMESPAIIFAVLMANSLRSQGSTAERQSHARMPLGKVLHESFTDGAQLLLLGAMLIGMLSGEAGRHAMQPFSGDLFKGMLAFFLLDMGLVAARNLPGLRGQSIWLIGYALLAPLAHASIALGLSWLLAVPVGDAVLLMVLAASASYIAVPAVLRYAIPEANPSLYVGLSLGLTFPFNILLGISLYARLASGILGA
jgi:hypothetical protein